MKETTKCMMDKIGYTFKDTALLETALTRAPRVRHKDRNVCVTLNHRIPSA